ncbi:hypothetical protein JCM19235_4340 [Vibrio maritimus]|uniref:Uncharacterized protein n=1 Tax=Vibrio maritimus TaxID=990268 RepID=A0A090RXF2_9VIBR|nr:hypothetical protein JCM19235_4340 [Vibrio maritimus]
MYKQLAFPLSNFPTFYVCNHSLVMGAVFCIPLHWYKKAIAAERQWQKYVLCGDQQLCV